MRCLPDLGGRPFRVSRPVPPRIVEREERRVFGGTHYREPPSGRRIRGVVPGPQVRPRRVCREASDGPHRGRRSVRGEDRESSDDAPHRTARRRWLARRLAVGVTGQNPDENQAAIVRRNSALPVRHREERDVSPGDRVAVLHRITGRTRPVPEIPRVRQRIAVRIHRLRAEVDGRNGRLAWGPELQYDGLRVRGDRPNRWSTVRLSHGERDGGNRHHGDDQDRRDPAPRPLAGDRFRRGRLGGSFFLFCFGFQAAPPRRKLRREQGSPH